MATTRPEITRMAGWRSQNPEEHAVECFRCGPIRQVRACRDPDHGNLRHLSFDALSYREYVRGIAFSDDERPGHRELTQALPSRLLGQGGGDPARMGTPGGGPLVETRTSVRNR